MEYLVSILHVTHTSQTLPGPHAAHGGFVKMMRFNFLRHAPTGLLRDLFVSILYYSKYKPVYVFVWSNIILISKGCNDWFLLIIIN